MSSTKFNKVGWILLSILLSFITFILVQWSTSELSSIINFISLFIGYAIYGCITNRWYPVVGFLSLGLTFSITLLLDNALEIYHIIQLSFCSFGILTSYFITRKKYIGLFFTSVFSITYLLLIQNLYLNSLDFQDQINTDLSILEKNNQFLSSHNGEHPDFNNDTVYLVNFGFRNCLPCRHKKTSLKKIQSYFKNKAFKIIEIHCFESDEIFQSYYKLDYAISYHDSLNQISKELKISGAPTEIIFNKNGQAVRRLDGFNAESAASYFKSTKNLIKQLLNEK